MEHSSDPLAAASTLTPGLTIDRGDSKLVVDAKVGEGGMGVVYRAWRFFPPGDVRARSGPQLVALKALRAQRAADPRVHAYFMREAKALRVLSHPNVVTFEELFDHGGGAVLAMEHVDGEGLDVIIRRHRMRAGSSMPCMPALRALAYFEQLLGALAALHLVGIVHRDVKPANLLVRRDGIVKLTDFGIAKQQADPADGGVAPGTGTYMSPEQVMGQAVDGRSDLYSATIVLYEMLAGKPPFGGRGTGEAETRQQQLMVRPPPVRSFFAHLPAAVDDFFEQALQKDPQARFSSAIALGTAARCAFGLGEDEGWRAQAEMALANTSPDTDRMGTLRDIIVERYRTGA